MRAGAVIRSNTVYSTVSLQKFLLCCEQTLLMDFIRSGFCEPTQSEKMHTQKDYRNKYREGGDCLDIEVRGWVV